MSILRTAARVGVATSVHGKVQRRQHSRWAAQDAAAAAAPPAAPVVAAVPPIPAEAATVPPAAPAAAATDILAQLTQLGELRAAGVLTEAEFQQQKARILA